MTKPYELLYLIPTTVSEDDLPQVTGKVAKLITTHGGTISANELWLKRKLSYPIKSFQHAYYWRILYQIQPTVNVKINHDLRLQPEVIRFIMTEPVAPPPPRESRQKAPIRLEKQVVPSFKKPTVTKKEEKVSLEELDRKLDEILEGDMNEQ